MPVSMQLGRPANVSGRIACLLVLAAPLFGGGVWRVGPSRTFTAIQPAVDVARTGDVVLVDPGTYAGFTVTGKGIAVVAASGSFEVTTSVAAPAVLVRGVAAPDQVTILGARVRYASTTQPAVRVVGNTGAVRVSQLEVELVADLCPAAQQAAVMVETTATFWLIDSRVFRSAPRRATTTNPVGNNDGISAVFVSASDSVVQNCQLAGFDACGTGYAGDALRITGNTAVWLVDDYAQSPTASVFRGGDGGAYGGNALHYLGAKSGLTRITFCGRTSLTGGTGSVLAGGPLALNNDGGLVQPGVWRLPQPCTGAQVAQCSVDAPSVPPGGNLRLRVYTLTNRSYVLVASAGTLFRRNLLGLGLAGRGVVDLTVPGVLIAAAGVTTGQTATVLNFPVPPVPALSGLQLTFQSLIGPVNGVGNTLSFPSLAVITQ